jgi:hypothetical protein
MLNDKKMKKMKNKIYTIIIGALFLVFIPSCDYNNETPPPVVEFTYGNIVTVQQVKALYADQLAIADYTLRVPVQITEDWALKGIITASDKIDGNLYKEAYIEDATGGLRMVFNSTSGLNIGDSVIVNIKDLFIGDYGNFWQLGSEPYHQDNGDIRVSGIDVYNNVLKISIDNPTFPAVATITQAKSAAYLGKLVTLNNVQFTDEMNGLTWADAKNLATMNRDLEDCSGKSIIVRTSGFAYYAGENLPTGKGSITGIVTIFSGTYQFIVRDYTEVLMTGDRCGYVPQPLGSPVETLSQNFTGFTADQTIYITGWQNLAQTGGRTWMAKTFSGNTYAQATAYTSTAPSIISWLITPPVTISAQKILSFQSAMAYWNHGTSETPLEVFYSTDYNGTNLTTATWVKLSATLATSTSLPNYTFVNSGNISLPVEAGKNAVIAFKYTGSNTKTTSICIDNIVVTAAK